MKVATYFALGLSLSAMFSCEPEEQRPLTAPERQEVSQRYADSVRRLTPLVDSICTTDQEKLTAQFTDSLFRSRIADLRKAPQQ